VHKCLDNSVVCGIHVSIQGERALAVTVEGLVIVRCNYPLFPSQVLEAHPEYALLTMPISELPAICINVRISIAPIEVVLNCRVLLLFLL